MKLIMENWRGFLKEYTETHPMVDPRLDKEQKADCKKKGISVMTKTTPVYGKASDCAQRGWRTPECGPQVGSDFDNKKVCPKGKYCNMTHTCVVCCNRYGCNGPDPDMEKYSNCDGKNVLKDYVFYTDPNGHFKTIYSSKHKKIMNVPLKFISTILGRQLSTIKSPSYVTPSGFKPFFKAREMLKRAKATALRDSTYRLGMYKGDL